MLQKPFSINQISNDSPHPLITPQWDQHPCQTESLIVSTDKWSTVDRRKTHMNKHKCMLWVQKWKGGNTQFLQWLHSRSVTPLSFIKFFLKRGCYELDRVKPAEDDNTPSWFSHPTNSTLKVIELLQLLSGPIARQQSLKKASSASR